MKKEDIYNGITEIRDDLIEGAAKKRGRPRIWQSLVAAGLAAVIALGGFAFWRQRDIPGDGGGAPTPPISSGTEDPTNGSPGETPPKEPTGGGSQGETRPTQPADPHTPASVQTLAAAVYPERPVFPVGSWGKDYDIWHENMLARELTDGELSAMTDWNTAAVRTLLSGHGDGNVVCSPTNLYLALSMLSEITGGETRTQILEALGMDSVEALRAQANRLWNALYNDDGTYSLTLANSLWLQGGGEYLEEPLDILAGNYYASAFSGEMGSEEYDAALREWIDSNTGDLLTNQTGELGFEQDTKLALVSTLYFDNSWQLPFNGALTAPGVFHAPQGDVERDLLHNTVESRVFRTDRFTAMELQFEMGGSMRLLLPAEGVEPEELLSDPAALKILSGGELSGGELMDVTLTLPKFDVSFDGDIVESVEELGITDAFDPYKADFSPISGEPLYAYEALHAARVTIDEDGCVAASYTLVGMDTKGPGGNEDIELTFDRPFLFAVVSQSQPIFAGIVNEP